MKIDMNKLSDKVDSRYTLAILAAKRAREINNYMNSLHRGELSHDRGPQVDMPNGKPLTIAFEEIAEDKVGYVRAGDDVK